MPVGANSDPLDPRLMLADRDTPDPRLMLADRDTPDPRLMLAKLARAFGDFAKNLG